MIQINKELQLRIFSAIIYAVIIIGCLLYSWKSSAILLGVFMALCLFEFYRGVYSGNAKKIRPVLLLHGLISAGVYYLIESRHQLSIMLGILGLYIFINIGSLIFNKRSLVHLKPHFLHGMLYINLPFLSGILTLKIFPDFHIKFLYIFIIVWLCDVFAYFAGRAFGKRKLFPTVSPNKTWAGLIGGIFGSFLAGFIILLCDKDYSQVQFLVLSITICITAVFGDLIESSFKRTLGIKDSGSLIPGHGGFLDRLDSFIVSMPIFLFIIILIYK